MSQATFSLGFAQMKPGGLHNTAWRFRIWVVRAGLVQGSAFRRNGKKMKDRERKKEKRKKVLERTNIWLPDVNCEDQEQNIAKTSSAI
ncbi:UNVERIFIED_CONTAM: hypothetical protein FKN15_053755 [Acipenser sinensis]